MFLNIFRSQQNLFNVIKTPNYLTSIRFLNYVPIQATTKITAGHKMTQVIDKNRQKAIFNEFERRKMLPRNKNSQHLLISCSSPSFNHYHGQLYKKFTPLNLASVGWLARASSGKSFTINACGKHPSLTDESYSFQHLNINPELIHILKSKLQIERL